ncbi:hypothetical protein HY486_01855 [Candidatus Woesearchaeota archaeon]|nr:hypothetical protein [Candidatus Woesearchaeota archaeon]
MEETKGVALAILGIVAVVAVFGLVLLFTSAKTGKVSAYVQGPSSWDDMVAECEAGQGDPRTCDEILGAHYDSLAQTQPEFDYDQTAYSTARYG